MQTSPETRSSAACRDGARHGDRRRTWQPRLHREVRRRHTDRGDGTLADIAGFAQVVAHGIDFDGNGAYAINPDDRFASEESSIVPGAPLELTAPVLCGGVPN